VTEAKRVGSEHVERRAEELLEGGSEGHGRVVEDEEAARAAAASILEESEQRVADPAARDPQDPRVVRRSSDETA
jgi:hypothetical protein